MGVDPQVVRSGHRAVRLPQLGSVPPTGDIGYDLARDQWGQGSATEALTAAIRFGFAEMLLNRIEAQTIADNASSTRLLGRLGFAREGTRRRYSWEEDGTFHDGAIYGLLRDR